MNEPRVVFLTEDLDDDADYDEVQIDGVSYGSREQLEETDYLDILNISHERRVK